MTGKSFTPAQQAWPPLILEGFAQLAGKRAQKRVLGACKTLNWTDHANFTKQQTLDGPDLDVKMLRWVSEIVADGSEIRSLAGRSCRLGDGTSRNPSDRDALVEQRTTDLKGLIGQVRGFDLDQFLSDYEDPGSAIPWSLGSDAWVDSLKKQALKSAPTSIQQIASVAGVPIKLKILYCPDYVQPSMRITISSRLYQEFSRLLPSYEIQLALAEGPFEDDDGIGAHFDKDALKGYPVNKRILATKVDFHSSVVKLARHATLHQPKIIFGDGQGALIAMGLSRPFLLEQALSTRNVQRREVYTIAQAWGNVSAIILHEPRMSKQGLPVENLKIAVPEFFDMTFPVPALRCFAIKESKSSDYKALKELYGTFKVNVVDDLGQIQLDSLALEPARLMWEHSGECACGRRTYLFGQCTKCLKIEASEIAAEVEDNALDLVPTDTLLPSATGCMTHRTGGVAMKAVIRLMTGGIDGAQVGWGQVRAADKPELRELA
jgi:hypothetical protein